ncbi:hypothetical protein [Halorussus marinus]|uniref:hypothetical protein n=1 Tax=Halorussus marinus TaxID=2505976 RepID=UPI001092E4BB|nr:hypothetical protein [Halorussus marinus]
MSLSRTLPAVALVLILLVAGCAGTGTSAPETTETETVAELPLRTWSVTQDTTDNGSTIEISGMVLNTGEESVSGTMEVALLNESSPVATRTLELEDVSPEEQVEFSVEFDINATEVDGRRISFSR